MVYPIEPFSDISNNVWDNNGHEQVVSVSIQKPWLHPPIQQALPPPIVLFEKSCVIEDEIWGIPFLPIVIVYKKL